MIGRIIGSSGQSYFWYPMARTFGNAALGSIGVNTFAFVIGVASAGGDACGTCSGTVLGVLKNGVAVIGVASTGGGACGTNIGTVGVAVIGLAFGTGKPELSVV